MGENKNSGLSRIGLNSSTVHAVINELVDDLANGEIEEIYVITRDSSGGYDIRMHGDCGGLALSIAILQQYLMEHL